MLMASTPFGVSAGRFRLFHVVSRAQIQRFRRSRFFMQRDRFPAAPCHSFFEPAGSDLDSPRGPAPGQ